MKLLYTLFIFTLLISCDSANTNSDTNKALKINYITPFKNQENVYINTSIMIKFSEKTRMFSDNTIQFLTVYDNDNNIVTGSIEWNINSVDNDDDEKCLIFIPDSTFKKNSFYTIEVNSNAIDIYGNTLKSTFKSSFHTSDLPEVNPLGCKIVSCTRDKVVIKTYDSDTDFNNADADPRTITTSNIKLKHHGITNTAKYFNYDFHKKHITIYPITKFNPNDTYTVFIPIGGLKNLAGIANTGSASYDFTVPSE